MSWLGRLGLGCVRSGGEWGGGSDSEGGRIKLSFQTFKSNCIHYMF